MQDLPTWLVASLNDPFRLIPKIEWSPDWKTWLPLRPLSGSHSQSRTRQARWEFSGTFAKDYPTGERGIHPYGPRLRIRLGIKTIRNPVFWIPQGVYTLLTVEEAEDSIGLGGSSLEIDVMQSEFVRTRRVPDRRYMTYREQAEVLIKEAVPDARFYWDPRLNYRERMPVGFFDSDRWGIIDGNDDDPSIMGALGGEAYCDAFGGFRFRAVPTLVDPPVWRVAKGGALVTQTRALDRDEVYNVVAAMGDSADGSESFGPVYAWDSDPTSLTYAGPNPVLRPGQGASRFGVRPFVYTNSLINSDAQAGVAARAQLANRLGLHLGLALTTRFNPAVEAGDVIEAEDFEGRVDRYLLDGLTYTWGAASMTAEVRSPKEVFNPVALRRQNAVIAVSDESNFNPLAPEDEADIVPPPPPVVVQPPPPDPDPQPTKPVAGTRTFSATAGRSYGSDGSKHSDSQMYQGYYSGTWGNNRSAIMFDYTAIQAALAGKTVTGCKITFRVQFSYYNSGVAAVIGTHNTATTGRPATWANVLGEKVNRVRKGDCKAGNTYTVSLGTTIGREFKAGTAKGIVFGPGPNTGKGYYGYHYLSGIKLTFTYTTP
jgi:hypothetical protein